MLHNQEGLAAAVAEAIRDSCPAPLLYWPAPVDLHALPRAVRKLGIDVVGEVYFDLSYSDDAQLIVERKKTPKNLEDIKMRVRRYLEEDVILAQSGKPIVLDAQSICIHGDGPNSVEIVKTVRAVLTEEGVAVAAWRLPPRRAREGRQSHDI